MEENRKTGRLNSLMERIDRKFTAMNKGSRLLVRIASLFLAISVAVTVFLVISHMTGMITFSNQAQIIHWMVLYTVRAWALMFCGALILDYLVSNPSK